MAFLTGLILGLSMILPIGPQNLFVLQSGIIGGLRRGMIAAATAGVCDTALILIGAAGLSAVFTTVPALRLVLLWAGVVFLVYLGASAFRTLPAAPAVPINATNATASTTGQVPLPVPSSLRQIVTGIGVSWGNPHAILDTVAVLGSAIAAQGAASRGAFTAGTVTASWLFFLVLAVTGGVFGARLPASTQVWIRRASGGIMLVFAAVLCVEAVRSLFV